MSSSKEKIRTVPLIAILVCGIFLLGIGLYLTINGMVIPGKLFRGHRGGAQVVHGPTISVLAIILVSFAGYFLWRQRNDISGEEE